MTLSGSAAIESFQVDASTPPGTNPVLPNGSGVVTITGGQVAAGTTTNVIRTDSLAANTYTIQIQRSQAVGVSTVGDNGVSHFNSTFFTVDANGFVSVSGTGLGQTITGNTGGALSPTAGNWNIVGTGSLTSAGSGSTLTFSLTGLTAHNVLLGEGTATVGLVAPSATSGVPLISQGAAADPVFGTALIAGGGTASVSFNTTGVVITGATSTTALTAVTLTDGQLAIGSSIGNPAAATLTAGTGISIINGHNSITIAATGSEMVWTDKSTNFSAVSGNGYFITGTAVATMPSTPSQGDTISFVVVTGGALTVTGNTGQVLAIGSASSAAAGTAVNNAVGDSVTFVYRSTSTTWRATSVIGTFTVT